MITAWFISVCWMSLKFKMFIQTLRMIALSRRVEVGRWSEGRPVFKKVDGRSRFLLVQEGWSNAWTIRQSTTDDGAYIQSGRATSSPAAPEAGSQVGEEVTRWRYAAPGNTWEEGDISVTCEERRRGGEAEEKEEEAGPWVGES